MLIMLFFFSFTLQNFIIAHLIGMEALAFAFSALCCAFVYQEFDSSYMFTYDLDKVI